MKQVRKNVFETNSSSQHSIVMTNKKCTEEELKIYFDFYSSNGIIHVHGYEIEYGRSPFRVLNTFRDKLLFAIASMQKDFNEIINAGMQVCSEFKGVDYRQYEYGYIEDGSEGLLHGFLLKHNMTYDEFLANPDIIVIIDGDEYCIWSDIKKSCPTILDSIVEEYPMAY